MLHWIQALSQYFILRQKQASDITKKLQLAFSSHLIRYSKGFPVQTGSKGQEQATETHVWGLTSRPSIVGLGFGVPLNARAAAKKRGSVTARF